MTSRFAAALAVVVSAGAACRGTHNPNEITASGHVEATEVRVSTKIAGHGSSASPSTEGDRVTAGQELARDRHHRRRARARRRAGPSAAQADGRAAPARWPARARRTSREAQAQVARAEADLRRRAEGPGAHGGAAGRGSGTAKSRDDARTRRDVAAASARRPRASALAPAEGRQPAARRSTPPRARVAGRRRAHRPARAADRRTPSIASPRGGRGDREARRAGRAAQRAARRSAWSPTWPTPGSPSTCAEPDLGAHPPRPGGRGRHRRRPDAQGHASPSSPPQAEFTPKNVQTRDERVKLVYKVKIGLDNRGRPVQARHARRGAPPRGRRSRRAPMSADVAGPGRGPDAPLRRRWWRSTASRFEVHRGEMFGLIGPDGAGKTTTLRVLLGLLPAHGGTRRAPAASTRCASGARAVADASATSRSASRSTAT